GGACASARGTREPKTPIKRLVRTRESRRVLVRIVISGEVESIPPHRNRIVRRAPVVRAARFLPWARRRSFPLRRAGGGASHELDYSSAFQVYPSGGMRRGRRGG